MLRHANLAVSAALLLVLAAPVSAVDINADVLSVVEYDQGSLIGPFFEADISFATGAFNAGTFNLSSPATSGPLQFDGTFGGSDTWFVDEPIGSANGSTLTVGLTGANTASLGILNTVTPVTGFPALSSFSLQGTDLIVNWDCTTCIQGATSTANFMNISVFDVASDGDVFDTLFNTNDPMGFSGQAIIDISGAIAGDYGIELEFFSQRTFSDSVSDPGNTWNVIEGRSALNGGFGFTVVPEPGTGVLVGMGLIGMARRRNRL